MISDILDHANDATLHADVAIVGSSFAGIEIARQLRHAGASVLVLESGRKDFDPKIQALYQEKHVGKPHRSYSPDAGFHKNLPPHYRGLNRVRQFGGTSNSWTGKWRPYEATDLEQKAWIPETGWPIGVDDLMPAYRAVAKDYGLGDVFEAMEQPPFAAHRDTLADAGLRMAGHCWELSPTRIPERFGKELAEDEHIHVVCGASVTRLDLDTTRQRVATVVCQCLEGRRITVSADAVVLAMGGLETPRLLLASNAQLDAGIGNSHDLVGRYYTDHSKCQTIKLHPGPALAKLAVELQGTPRPRFSFCVMLDDPTLARHNLLRHSLYFSPNYLSRGGHAMRLLHGKRPFKDNVGAIDHYTVKFAGEQQPQPDSRVYLGEQRDALGMPELVIDWRFTEMDHRSIRESCVLLKQRLSEAGFGELELPADPMTLDQTSDAAHPTGTTRMADSPQRGVVDRDGKVFGTDNLYLAGSATFPSGSVYSPTYTIVALAHRLGRHLADQLKRGTA